MLDFLLLIAGAAAGAVAAWLHLRTSAAVLAERLTSREAESQRLAAQLKESQSWSEAVEKEGVRLRTVESELRATLEAERKSAAEKLAVLEDARKQLEDAFKALAGDALRNNNEAFLALAKGTFEGLVKPVQEQLEKVGQTETRLRSETDKLVSALWTPTASGAWGEFKLEHALRVAGLDAGIHYEEQPQLEGGAYRPDLIVRLPGGRCLIVDAKFPQTAYEQAGAAADEAARAARLRDHARNVRAHVKALADKKYWDRAPGALEFVVMFLPHDGLLTAALEQDRALLDEAAVAKVLIATPTALIALLMAVQHGWQQEAVAKSAREIHELGRRLYDRLRLLGSHFDEMRKGLQMAVDAYNATVGSLEARFLVTARELKERVPTIGNELAPAMPVVGTLRKVEAEEIASAAHAGD